MSPAHTWVGDVNGDGKPDVFQIWSNGMWVVLYSGTGKRTSINKGGVDVLRMTMV